MENEELRKADESHTAKRAPFSILNSQFSIAFLLSLFIVLCLVNNVVLPVFEASDEASHFRYADYLASAGRLPDLKRDLPSHEVTQPLLYYVLVAAAISPFDRTQLPEISHLNPDWFDKSINADYQSVRPLHLHTPLERWPWSSVVWAVHIGRLVSTLLGAATVFFVYKIVLELASAGLNTQRWALFSAALVAFNPKFIHMSAIVNNDGAITLAATVACWWMLRMCSPARKPQHPGRDAFVLGLLLGLAVLCKLSGLGLALPALVAVLSVSSFEPRPIAFGSRIKSIAACLAALVLGFLLIAGIWLIFNQVNYGNPLAWAQVRAANEALLRTPPLNLQQMLAAIRQILESYWGVLGIELHYPAWVNGVFYLLLGLALLGWVVAAARQITNAARLSTLRQTPAGLGLQAAPFSAQLNVLWLWELALLASYALWLRNYVGTENGRLILPGVAPVVVLVALGWAAIVPLRLRRAFASGVLLWMVALSAVTPWWIIRPAFAPPPFLNAAEIAPLTADNNPVFNGQIKLLRAELGTRTPHGDAGQMRSELPVTLYWGAQQKMNQSYHVDLRVVDVDGAVIGQLQALPFHGQFATTQWPIGQFFRDDYTVVISPTKPTIARVELRLYQQYPQPGFLPLTQNGEQFLIGRVRAGPLVSNADSAAQPTLAYFGEGIVLTQATVTSTTLDLRWRCRDAPQQDYTLFVHVFDKAGGLVAQFDGQPRQGEAPTGLWMTGDQITDMRPIALPPNAARVQIGWYDAQTGARLPATRSDGSRWADDAVIIWQGSSP